MALLLIFPIGIFPGRVSGGIQIDVSHLKNVKNIKQYELSERTTFVLSFRSSIKTEMEFMTDNRRPGVERIIERFKSQLDPNVLEQISNAQFTDLALMIDAAIAEEISSAADLVEEAVKKLRASSRKPELEL